jgi:hypothetical protein
MTDQDLLLSPNDDQVLHITHNSDDVHFADFNNYIEKFIIPSEKEQEEERQKLEKEQEEERQKFMINLTNTLDNFNSKMREFRTSTKLYIVTKKRYEFAKDLGQNIRFQNELLDDTHTKRRAYRDLIIAWNSFAKQIQPSCYKYDICVRNGKPVIESCRLL